jgi:predicted Zn-dependent protease
LNEKPTGHGRAVSFNYFPIPRMTNTVVMPGKYKEKELFESII